MHSRWLTLAFSVFLGLVLVAVWAHHSPEHDDVLAMVDSVAPGAIVINEVAWGGTAASPADEWIELINTSAVTVSLAGWRIRAIDGDPNLLLTGDVGPGAYYLIERTDDTTVSDIEADQTCPFGTGLSNGGESLVLQNANGQLVDTANGDGGPWPNVDEGAAPLYLSLERRTPYAADADANWVSNDASIVTGLDATGNPLTGTPASRNAAYDPLYRQSADLTVALSGPEALLAGTFATYTIAVRNQGGLSALDAVVTDLLPPLLSFASQQSPYPYVQIGDTITWFVGDIAPDGNAAIELTARTAELLEAGLVITNEITATSSVTEAGPLNNAASWTLVTQAPSTNLIITKAGPEAILSQSDPIDYRIIVTNAGTYTASQVTIVDVLPSEVQLLDYAAQIPSTVTPGRVEWRISQMPPGQTQILTLSTHLALPVALVDEVTNQVTVTTQTPDTEPTDSSATATTTVGAPHLAIACVMYDGYQDNDADEAVELINTGTAAARLLGWSLCKDVDSQLTCYALPSIEIPVGATAWLVKDIAAFTSSFGFAPQAELTLWPRLVNTGDELVLRAPDGRFADTLVYGDGSTNVPGWEGPALEYYAGLRGEAGQLLCRKADELTALPIADTNTTADWIQDTQDALYGRRVRYAGWDIDLLSRPLSLTEPLTLVVGIAPDNAYQVVADLLLGAQRSISIEVYSLTHPGLIEILVQQARRGVATSVLLEGNPVGVATTSIQWQTQLYACQVIEQAGGECWFMVHDPGTHVYNRYEYLHAKVAIVDDTWTIIGSQNMTQAGLPDDEKINGTSGSRGAVVAIASTALARRSSEVFRLDLDPINHQDIVRWNTFDTDRYGIPNEDLVDLTPVDGISYTVRFTDPLTLSVTAGLEFITAPESALRHSDGLLGLLARAGAGDTVLVEQLYEDVTWGADPATEPNLRLAAYISAARRGARVRVLLNGRNFAEGAPGPAEEGLITTQYLNEIAASEQLDLRAAVGNPTGEGIHNKMVLVSFAGGDQVAHIGSINGSEASSKVNREVAVQVTSPEVYTYLARAFSVDWSMANAILLPVVMRIYTPPPPPADHVLIGEVCYTGSADGEWIEVYNPTSSPISMESYKLGDAENAGAYEGMFLFPPGTAIQPGATLVIAVNGSQVPQADYEFYESTPLVANMVPYTAWGSTEYPLALRDDGDQVLLLDALDRAADVVAWGDKGYPGLVPHPGVTTAGASLERFPAGRDTDDCAQDFRERYPPTPGALPGLAR